MTDGRWDDQLRINIARLLRQVETLALDLHAQALATPNDREFPGGRALNMLGPAAVLQDWEALYEAKEAAERFDPKTGKDRWEGPLTPKGDPTSNKLDPAVYEREEESAEQPLNVLTYWTRVIREERDQPTQLAPTLSREVDFLRKQIDWMVRTDDYDQPVWMEAFEVEKDLRTLVRRMENTLRDGDRIDTDAAPCFQLVMRDDDEGVPTLVQCKGTLARVNLKPQPCEHTLMGSRWAALNAVMREAHKRCEQGGRDDLYRCLDCQKIYTPAEYWLAVREHMEREAG